MRESLQHCGMSRGVVNSGVRVKVNDVVCGAIVPDEGFGCDVCLRGGGCCVFGIGC